MAYTAEDIKTLPAPSVKKLLREAGYTMADVARRRGVSKSLVSRVVRKKHPSAPVWEDVAWCLNHPKNPGQRAA